MAHLPERLSIAIRFLPLDAIMLTPEQRLTLSMVLAARLSFPVSIPLARPFVGDIIASRLPALPNLKDYADWMIIEALCQPGPATFVTLILAVDNPAISQGIDSLLLLARQLQQNPAGWVPMGQQQRNSWNLADDPGLLAGGKPFIDRQSFRQLLPRGVNTSTPACTVVHADRGHGKSYLVDYSKTYAAQWPELRVGYFEVPKSGAGDLDPGMVADEIALGLGTDRKMRPREHEDSHRHARDLADWIVSFTPPLDAPPPSAPALILLDGFDQPDVAPAAHTFALELARRIGLNPGAAGRLRVLLLGFSEAILEAEKIPRASCVLEFVGAPEIEDWFRKQYPGRPDYVYGDTASVILAGLPDDGPLRMRKICTRVHAATSQF